jgi:flagella basal body P-ring formation protein FlgA
MRALAMAAALSFALAPLGVRASTGSAQAAISGQRISGKRIASLAERVVATLAHGADQNFVPACEGPDQIVSDGQVDLKAQSPIGTSTFVNVPVQIDVDGRLDRTVFVGYRIQQYIETAVAAHDLAPGTVLEADDLTMARVPYAGYPGNSVDVLVGRRVQGAFLKDQPITIEATAVNQIVKAGSTVMFIVRDDGVAVFADAIARTGGGLGDQVFVFNPATHKALSGVVTGPGTVELDISGGDSQ